jgi:hypothetical protein
MPGGDDDDWDGGGGGGVGSVHRPFDAYGGLLYSGRMGREAGDSVDEYASDSDALPSAHDDPRMLSLYQGDAGTPAGLGGLLPGSAPNLASFAAFEGDRLGRDRQSRDSDRDGVVAQVPSVVTSPSGHMAYGAGSRSGPGVRRAPDDDGVKYRSTWLFRARSALTAYYFLVTLLLTWLLGVKVLPARGHRGG